MKSTVRLLALGIFASALLGAKLLSGVDAQEKKKGKETQGGEPNKAAVQRAREQAKMLDDLYKNAVVSITKRYVENQADTPAAMVAKDVFQAMQKNGHHSARLIDATGKPKNRDNVAKSDFEKKALDEMKGGKEYFEEVAQVEGKTVFRAATIVPTVMKQCATCHGTKEGSLLGVLIYELPVK